MHIYIKWSLCELESDSRSTFFQPLSTARTMGASSEVSGESKKHGFTAVSTREVDTAAELGSGDGPVDPTEALRVRLVLSICKLSSTI